MAGNRHRVSLLALTTTVLVALAGEGVFSVSGLSRACRRRVHLVELTDLRHLFHYLQATGRSLEVHSKSMYKADRGRHSSHPGYFVVMGLTWWVPEHVILILSQNETAWKPVICNRGVQPMPSVHWKAEGNIIIVPK